MQFHSVESALAQFEESSRISAEATESGDWRTNYYHRDRLISLYSFLREHGLLDALIPYLDDERVYMKIESAVCLLKVHEESALAALEDTAREPGIMGGNARTVLQEWRAGRLKL